MLILTSKICLMTTILTGKQSIIYHVWNTVTGLSRFKLFANSSLLSNNSFLPYAVAITWLYSVYHFAMCYNHSCIIFIHAIAVLSRYRIPNFNLTTWTYYTIVQHFYLDGCTFHLVLLKDIWRLFSFYTFDSAYNLSSAYLSFIYFFFICILLIRTFLIRILFFICIRFHAYTFYLFYTFSYFVYFFHSYTFHSCTFYLYTSQLFSFSHSYTFQALHKKALLRIILICDLFSAKSYIVSYFLNKKLDSLWINPYPLSSFCNF